MNYTNNSRHSIKIKNTLLLVTSFLSILIFEACAKSNNTTNINENKIETFENQPIEEFESQQIETFENQPIEKNENQQVETFEIQPIENQKVEIPKRNICQYIKIWEDGIENEPKQVNSKLMFSDDLSSLTLILSDRTVLKLKCLKPFKTNIVGETFATYNLPNGKEIVIGYFNEGPVNWYVKFKALDGSIQEAELSNDKNAWN